MEPTPHAAPPPAGPLRILVNPRAGRGRDGPVRGLASSLERWGVDAEVCPTPPEHLGAAVRREREEGAAAVGVGGGDGSLLSAANELAGSETVLAPIPMGTLNHFARRLGHENVETALRSLAAGEVSRVPVGIMDDRLFLNTATFGLYADVVRRRERLRRWLGKWPAALVGSVARLARMRQLEVVLEVEGRQLRRRTPLVWVGVGWGSFPFVHEAPERRCQPDLEIVVVRPGSVLGVVALLVRLIFHLLRGRRPVDDPALEVLHARKLLIRARRRVGITLDGEVLRGAPPLFVAIQDDALRVVVPAPQEEAVSSCP